LNYDDSLLVIDVSIKHGFGALKNFRALTKNLLFADDSDLLEHREASKKNRSLKQGVPKWFRSSLPNLMQGDTRTLVFDIDRRNKPSVIQVKGTTHALGEVSCKIHIEKQPRKSENKLDICDFQRMSLENSGIITFPEYQDYLNSDYVPLTPPKGFNYVNAIPCSLYKKAFYSNQNQ